MDRNGLRDLYETAKGYFQRHPQELGRVLRGLIGLRIGVPLDGLRWLAGRLAQAGGVRDLAIEAVPPGLRLAASLDLMKTPVRASAVVYVERVLVCAEELRVEVRLEEVQLALLEDVATPVALLVKSGALDLSRPADLIQHFPKRPPFLLEARGKRIALDFRKHPGIAGHPLTEHLLPLLTSLVTLHAVETDEAHLDFSFRAFPEGFGHASRNLREHLLRPTLERARLLLPGAP
jgi:hypothetical protein